MRVRTDDEVYRVDAVWLGPPKATFPWRARYVAWGVGVMVFLVVLAVERRMNIGFGFFSTAWAVVITIAMTRLICSRITHERPLSAVMVMWLRELSAPRETVRARGGAASAARVRISQQRPRPKQARRSGKPRRSGRAAKRSRQSTQSQSTRGGGTSRSPSRPRRPAEGTRPTGRSPNSKEVRGVRSRARS